MQFVGRLVIAFAILASATGAGAAPGNLDSSFGTGGLARVDLSTDQSVVIASSAMQADGKLIVAGGVQLESPAIVAMAIGRLNPDGSTDVSFGHRGWKILWPQDWAATDYTAAGVAVSDDGHIYAVSGGTGQVCIARLSVSGDTEFGYGDNQGFYCNFQPGVTARAMVIRGSSIGVTGYYVDPNTPGSRREAFAGLYFLGGAPDNNFGFLPGVVVPMGVGDSEGEAIWLDGNGGVYVAGYAYGGSSGRDFSMVKLGGFGIDFSFNGGSPVILDFAGGDDEATTLAPDPNGFFIVGGKAAPSPSSAESSFAMARIYAFGFVDTQFGVNGRLVAPVGPPGSAARLSTVIMTTTQFADYAIDGIGSVKNLSTGDEDFAVGRWYLTGSPIPEFGSNGVTVGPATAEGDSAVAGFLTNGQLVAVGRRAASGTAEYVATRYDEASGAVDASFGSGGLVAGKAFVPSDDVLDAAFPQPDGGTLLVGTRNQGLVFSRVTASGALDPSFGTNGFREIPITDLSQADPLVQPDGKVLVGWGTWNCIGNTCTPVEMVTRLNPDGSRDATFNGTGDAVVPGGPLSISSFAVQADGRILVGSETYFTGYRRHSVARFNVDGSVDTTFGSGGATVINSGLNGDDWSRALALQADGKILLAGRGPVGTDSTRAHVIRLMPDGSVDAAWGSAGVASAFPGRVSEFASVLVQPDGRVVAGGNCISTQTMCIARFNASGALDPSFGSSGQVEPGVEANQGGSVKVALQSDGKVLASQDDFFGTSFGVVRLTESGVLDPSFNTSGVVGIASPDTGWVKLLLQSDGGILLAATDNAWPDSDMILARVQGGGDTTPDAFAFTDVGGVPISTLVTSDAVAITGIDSVATIAISGGEYSVGCAGPWTAATGTVANGQSVCVRHTSSASPGTATNTTLTVGGAVSDTFTSTTAAAPDTSIAALPPNPSGSASASFSFFSPGAGATFECKLDAAIFATCASPAAYSALAEGSHTFQVRAVSSGGADPTPATFTWIVDTIAPDTAITSGPSGTVSSSGAAFAFSATETGVTFECRADGAAFAACASPVSLSALADGSHTFDVRGKDAAGNVDPTPASRTWTVDTTAPDTTLVFVPTSSPTNSTGANATFSSPDAGASFECRLDGAAFAACTSPVQLSALAEGTHTFDVRAKDAAGNVDPTPASHGWVVDLTAPDTSITSGPSGTVASTSATFAFGATEAGTFQCRLDAAAFASCASPVTLSGLGQGSHAFDVRAIDAAGNIDTTPASRSWGVDTVAPDTTITGGPGGTVASTAASLSFAADDPGAAFECRLDGAMFAACSSPVALSGLAQASHTFDVRAIDGAGNVDATPASRTWSVDTVPPETSITSGPTGPVASTSASFAFAADDPTASFECSLDGATFAPCANLISYSGLAQGSHQFDVRARDALGNTDATPASAAWTVDTVPPDTSITSGPGSPTSATSATFAFTSNEAGATFECRLDGAAFGACASPASYSGIVKGTHTFEVRAKDAAGNADATAAAYSWRVK